jgi:hypothetical protein
MTILLDDEMITNMRVSYALRRVPRARMATLLPCPVSPQAGDIALAKLEKIGKNAALELPNGRRCNLHEGADQRRPRADEWRSNGARCGDGWGD